MTVETFNLQKFTDVLDDILYTYGPDASLRAKASVVGVEHHFEIPYRKFPNDCVNIHINSSVRLDGVSAASGEDSIRAWLADCEGKPLGNKTQRWVTRVTGWEQRLEAMIAKLAKMANSINYCNTCNSIEKVFITKKEGANKGRFFKKCQCDNSFQWLDEFEQTADVVIIPTCPKCGSRMAKRNGRMGEFWGCTKYPSCKGTRNVGQEGLTEADYQDRQYKVAETTAKATNKPASKFIPSKYQQAIFDWVDAGYNGHPELQNLVVEALAGSGKTTTGVEMLKRVPRDKRVLFVAFNKHIAKTLQERAPAHVKASTLHSLGFTALRKAFKLGMNAVKDTKVKIILGAYMNLDVHYALVGPISNLVSLVKANLVDPTDEELSRLAEFYGVELNGDTAEIFPAVRYVIKRSMEMTDVIDFDDMCWLPVILNIPCDKYDFIFVDEAQDLNKCQLELAMAHCQKNTRFVAVGDRHQSLYGFRGADVQSIPTIIERLDAQVLPLSITYRCPSSIVEAVNERFPDIPLEAAETAKEGQLIHTGYGQAISNMVTGDMVVCRTNAPLVRPCFEIIRSGRKAVIRGRDIGKGLIVLVRKVKADNLNDLLTLLADYRDKEVAKLVNARKTGQAQSLEDRIDTIIALADGVDTVEQLERKIDSIFSDAEEGVIFSSIHRAKGLEANTVYILKPELMPHPMAVQDWEQVQEMNIEYVAMTRALDTLCYVGG